MQLIESYRTQRLTQAAAAILVVGAISILPGRLAAQESNAPSAATNELSGAPKTDSAPAAEQPTDRSLPAPSRLRTVRSGPGGPAPQRAPASISGRSLAQVPQAPVNIAPARFEATVYEVQLPENRIADLDAGVLETKAATAQDLAKALEAFGTTKVLHKIDQTVNLYGETITLSRNEPMVTATRMDNSGNAVNSISYQQVGLIVSLSASTPPPETQRSGLDVQLNLELSSLADSGVEIAPKVKASSTRNVQLSHSENVRFGKPLVMLNVSAPASNDKSLPTAYVVRYVFREIKP